MRRVVLFLLALGPALASMAQTRLRTRGLDTVVTVDSVARGNGDSLEAGRKAMELSFFLKNNTADTQAVFIHCGMVDFIDAWWNGVHTHGGNLYPVQPGSSQAERAFMTAPLRLLPREKGTVRLRLRQVDPNGGFSGLWLYSTDALNTAWAEEYQGEHAYYAFEWIFQGFLVFQLLYVLFQWVLLKRKEYLYYFCYVGVVALYFLSKFESALGLALLFSHFPLLKIYLAKTLLIFPYFLYTCFVQSFLDIPNRYPALNRWIAWIERFLLAYTVFDLALILATFNPRLQATFFTFILLMLFLLSTSFIVYLLRHRETLTWYILTGSFVVGIGNLLGQVFTYIQIYRGIDLGIEYILVFPQVGILLEILCFTAGLGHKNQLAEEEKLRGQERLIEQLQANELLQNRMQHIRNKIAQDLHDDIGSTLSSISILSDLALNDRDRGLSEIKDSAILLMERMDDIVWSINPRNDSLENLLMRVRHFATTLFEARGIEYDISIQRNIDELRLPMEFRQHVYLILKEAINNLVKYAGASHATIHVGFDAAVMNLSVTDDGRGFDADCPPEGNGVPGMRRRAELMGADLRIRSSEGGGTSVGLRVVLDKSDAVDKSDKHPMPG